MKKKSLKIGVLGSSGRMGVEVINQINLNPQFSVQWASSRVTEMGTGEDVVIDFSHRSQIGPMLLKTSSIKALVSGVTGLENKDHENLQKISKKIPTLWSANLSLGILWIRNAIEEFDLLSPGFDFSIEEFHHKHKKDAPSGTGLLLASSLNKKKRLVKDSDIKSFRMGEIYGTHLIHAVSESEWITIKHQALNRSVFASGALKAALWLNKKKPGLYEFKEILKTK